MRILHYSLLEVTATHTKPGKTLSGNTERRREWSYQLSREGGREGGRNITAGILKSDLTIKLILPATLSDK